MPWEADPDAVTHGLLARKDACVNSATQQKIITALHQARMQPYLAAKPGKPGEALKLYQWNTRLTAAVQEVLGMTEVVLRNAMDRELQVWNDGRTGGTASWLLHPPATPLAGLSGDKCKNAVKNAQKEFLARPAGHPRYGVAVSHDDVLAQVMFGLWKELLPDHPPGTVPTGQASINRQRLWVDAVSNAFPHRSDPDGSLTIPRVVRLHQLRNRVSHMEPLINTNVQQRIGDAFKLLGSIDPDVASWISGGSQVAAVLKQRP